MQYFVKVNDINGLQINDQIANVFKYDNLKELKKLKNANIFLNSLFILEFKEAEELFKKPRTYFLDQVKRALFKIAKLKVMGAIIKLPVYNTEELEPFGVKTLDTIARLGELLNLQIFIDTRENYVMDFIFTNKTKNNLFFVCDLNVGLKVNSSIKLLYFDNALFFSLNKNDQNDYLTKLTKIVSKHFLGVIFENSLKTKELIEIIDEELS